MEQVYYQVTLSMVLLKCVGGAIFLLGAAYLPGRRKVLGHGCLFGLLNAGLVIIIGKLSFFYYTNILDCDHGSFLF